MNTFSATNPTYSRPSGEWQLTVYFDGLCKLCSREMDHYRKQKGSEKIRFVDICSPEFAADREGLDPHLIHKIMHVRRADGVVVTRARAFIEIWKVLPRYQKIAQIAERPWALSLLERGYEVFARIRPYLPRYQNPVDCQESPYCDVRPVK